MQLKGHQIDEVQRKCLLVEPDETLTLRQAEPRDNGLILFYFDDESGQNVGSIWSDDIDQAWIEAWQAAAVTNKRRAA